MKIDLHSHTTASDGVLSARELVQLAQKKKVSVFSVTDHDTVSSLPEIQRFTEEVGIQFIPGIEISCHCQGEEIHILAYHIRYEDPSFLKFLQQASEDRFSRLKKMIEKLNEANVQVSFEDVKPYLKDESAPGRPHLAQALMKLGYVSSLKEAFRFYLDRGKVGYVSRAPLEAKAVLSKILKNGGVPVLAHPGLVKKILDILPELIQHGLRGIEVYHPSHTKSQREQFFNLAIQEKMIITGGSDFHGNEKQKRVLGSMPVPEDTVLKLSEAAKEIRSHF